MLPGSSASVSRLVSTSGSRLLATVEVREARTTARSAARAGSRAASIASITRVGEGGGGVEVRVGRLVLDLEVQRARPSCWPGASTSAQLRDRRAAAVLRRASCTKLPVVPRMSDRQSARSCGERARGHLPVQGVVRSSVASWITTGTRSLGELHVQLQHEAAHAPTLAKAGSVFSRVHGLAELERAAAMGVDERAGGERRRRHRQHPAQAARQAATTTGRTAGAGRRHGRILTRQRTADAAARVPVRLPAPPLG